MLPILEIPSTPIDTITTTSTTVEENITQSSSLPDNMDSILSRLPEQLAIQLIDFAQTNTINKAKVINNTPTVIPKRVRKIPKRKRKVVAEFCAWCSISTTPEWRRGPDGKNTLCNACGLKYAKGIRHEEAVIPPKKLKNNIRSKRDQPN